MPGLQRILSLIYPDQCLICDTLVDLYGALCPECWRGMPFLTGLLCRKCGVSLPGPGEGTGIEICDDCMTLARPWDRGAAALSYRDRGRRFVLLLKHGDRPELARPAARWMLRAGRQLLKDESLLLPVPVHRLRLLRRRYNQSAELARELAGLAGVEAQPDGLLRLRRTAVQDGMTLAQRFENQEGAINVNPARSRLIRGREVVLIDDVMTSGATLAAAARACHSAGASRISVLVLARVEKAP